MEVWVTPLDKELRLAEVLREGMGNRKGRKEGRYRFQSLQIAGTSMIVTLYIFFFVYNIYVFGIYSQF